MLTFNNFEQNLKKSCQLNQYSLALPESKDKRVLEAIIYLVENKCVKKILVFQKKFEFYENIKGLLYDKEKLEKHLVFVPDIEKDIDKKLFNFLIESLKNKKRSIKTDHIENLSQSPLYQAGYLLKRGEVDAALAGAVYYTKEVIHAALKTVGLYPGIKTISGAFLMLKEPKIKKPENTNNIAFLFADCGVVIEPTSEQIVDIAFETVKTWNFLNISNDKPRVAFLSFSTRGSADHPRVDKIREASDLFQKRYPNILAEGELQLDAAIDSSIASKKNPDGNIKGKANILIFPNLESGNIAYKITQRLGGYQAFGPILQGLSKPYSDLSRGASTKDIIISSFISMQRAQIK